MSGNEAAARGAWEAGVVVGVGYPGTPSTEVLESLVRYPEVRCEWAPNEKVALEVAAGTSLGGVRALATMKHVGLNVAADPLFTLAYTGVGGGLVVFVADDPAMHSSQNEQDTRALALAAKVPLLEPSDPAELASFMRRAFDLSERLDLPVIVRSTTRVSHSKAPVALGERMLVPERPFAPDVPKWVMVPAHARERRSSLQDRVAAARAVANEDDLAVVEMRDRSLGVITAGVAYAYVREALPDVSVLKLGMVHPIPDRTIRSFASVVERVAVVEELDPFIETHVRALGIDVMEVDLPRMGELTPGRIARAFGRTAPEPGAVEEGLPARPPLMCPGCPHRGVFWVLSRLGAIVTGDIGCYTLAAAPPLAAMHSCVCMGASVGMAHGLSLAGRTRRPVVAVIGDSTFAHSGITGLAHMTYNDGSGTVIILDNRTTAMTGHQGNPISGVRLDGTETHVIDLERLARSLGVSSVRTTDAFDLDATRATIEAAIAEEGVSVVITRGPCALLTRTHEEPYAIDEDLCTRCGVCLRLGCPAISRTADGRPLIDAALCVGCTQCVQVCRFQAIVPTGPACDLGGAS